MEFYKNRIAKDYFLQNLPESLHKKYSEAKILVLSDFYEDAAEHLGWTKNQTTANAQFVAAGFGFERFENKQQKDGRLIHKNRRYAIYTKQGVSVKEIIQELDKRHETTN